MKKKKLMIISGGLGSGGLDRVVSNIANFYADKGWSVVVLCMLDRPKEIFVDLRSNVDVEWANPKSMKLNAINKYIRVFSWIRFIRKNLLRYSPDAVLCMTFKIGSLAMLAKPRRCHSRFTVREISDPKSVARSPLMNFITFRICRKIDAFIFQTDWERQCCPKYIQNKGTVIPNPVILKTFCDLSIKKENRVVTMGRLLNKQKNHFVLFDAVKEFSNSRQDYLFEIYGTGPDYLEDEKYVQKKSISNLIEFKGAIKNVHEAIKNAACFVITSEYEGMSNALLEAFLMGIPCITSDWPGATEIVTHGVDGLVFKRGDYKQLCSHIEFLIDNPDIALQFSKRAQSLYSKYELTTIMEKYSRVINGE